MSQADQLFGAANALSAASSQYAQASNIEVAISTSIAYTVGDLQKTWQGKASQGFMAAWNRAVRDAANSSEALAHASTAMSKLASAITSNLQPFEDLPKVEFNETDPKVIAKAKLAVETATSAIQSAASTADGELQGLLSTVGTCSTGTEPLPAGWKAELNPESMKNVWTRDPQTGHWLEKFGVEGGNDIQIDSGYTGNNPPGNPPGSDGCGPGGGFNWKLFLAAWVFTTGASSIQPLVSSGPHTKRIIVANALVSGSNNALLSLGYNHLKEHWQGLCNAAKDPNKDVIYQAALNTIPAISLGLLVNRLIPTNQPTPKPTPKLMPKSNPIPRPIH